MAPPTIPKELIAYLSAASTTADHACEAVEEWILSRRSRGDTLFEISVGLVELEGKVRLSLELRQMCAWPISSWADTTTPCARL